MQSDGTKLPELTPSQLEGLRAAMLRKHPSLAVTQPLRHHNQGANRHERRATGAKKRGKR